MVTHDKLNESYVNQLESQVNSLKKFYGLVVQLVQSEIKNKTIETPDEIFQAIKDALHNKESTSNNANLLGLSSSLQFNSKVESEHVVFKQAYKLLKLKYRKYANIDPNKYRSTLLKNKRLKGNYL